MKHRILLLLAFGTVGSAGIFAAACSSSSGGGFNGPDGSSDGATGGDNTVSPDSPLGGDSAGMDRATGGDRMTPPPDSSITDGGGVFDGPLANCSPANSACDIVSQNCPSGNECAVTLLPDGGIGTVCQPDQASQHLPAGHSCCPSGANPCNPGLECIGNPCDPDAAVPQTGRCTPHCCSGMDSVCGSSVPEGYPGHCDLNIVSPNDPNQTLYSVCTYASICEPLHVLPCPAGAACEVMDMSGTANCTQTFNPDGGAPLGEKQTCTFLNECADGLMCLGPPDGGSECLWLCYITGQNPPFDAGQLNGNPGFGGCPVGENCQGVNGFPTWLGVCL